MRFSSAVLLAASATELSSAFVATPSEGSAEPSSTAVVYQFAQQRHRPGLLEHHHALQSSRVPPKVAWDFGSRWRKISNLVIERLWRQPQCQEDVTPRAGKKSSSRLSTKDQRSKGTGQQPPAHTFAMYEGDVVLRFNVSTSEEASSVADAANTLLLDVWEFSRDWVDLRLAKELVPSLLGLLPDSLQNSHVPLLQERQLAEAIIDTYPTPKDHVMHDASQRPFGPELRSKGAESNVFFEDYQPLSVISPWLRLLSSLFTTHVRLISIGVSAEGRDIPALRIGVHPTNDEDPDAPKRKTILVTAGLHAREWIGTSTASYIAYSLITAYGKDPHITRLVEDFDFVIVPTLNPDGYAYTWETDRLWRKTRQPTSVRFCPGLDLDHTFGFEWDGAATASNPCSESYSGSAPLEAAESQALSSWARNETEHNNVDFVGLLDLHSYSQQILYPYSYSCSASPPGLEDLQEMAYGLEKSIRLAYGHSYEVMPACEGNSVMSKQKRELLPFVETRGGSALDWFYHEMRVRWAYQIKLRDRGTYGFLLPKENIVPTGKEILEAVLYFGKFLQGTYSADERKDAVEGLEQEVEPSKFAQEAIEEEESSDAGVETISDDEDSWILVEDLGEHPDEPQWELRRRRRR